MATAVAAGRRVLVPPAFTARPNGCGSCGRAVALAEGGAEGTGGGGGAPCWRVALEHGARAPDGLSEAVVPEHQLRAAPPRLPWLNYMCTPKTWATVRGLEVGRMQAWRKRRDNLTTRGLRAPPRPPTLLRACEQTTATTGIQHSKVYVRHFADGSGACYIGSHNYSPAAWGAPRLLAAGAEERKGASQVLESTARGCP